MTLLTLVAVVVLTSNNPHNYDNDNGDKSNINRSPDGPPSPLRNVKPLAFALPATWEAEVAASIAEDAFERKPLYPPSLPISQALDALLDNVARDFVRSWYRHVSPDPAFARQVDGLIWHAVGRIAERLLTVDVPELLVGTLAPLLTAHLHGFSAAERAVRGRRLEVRLTESEELDLAIAAKYRNGNLHAAAGLKSADTKQAQQDHLRQLVDKILPQLLPATEQNSRLVAILVREILACGVLFPALTVLSDPDSWNRLIEAIVMLPSCSIKNYTC